MNTTWIILTEKTLAPLLALVRAIVMGEGRSASAWCLEAVLDDPMMTSGCLEAVLVLLIIDGSVSGSLEAS